VGGKLVLCHFKSSSIAASRVIAITIAVIMFVVAPPAGTAAVFYNAPPAFENLDQLAAAVINIPITLDTSFWSL
jgi:hypothetical protein